MSRSEPPLLLVVLGPTGSGKSELAHQVAIRTGGEIVSADAFAVYRGFDVGTDKPDAEHRREVRYHMIDLADPDEPFSAGRWARQGRGVIEEIAGRGRLPIVCGGTGFYISALLESLPPSDPRETSLRGPLSRWAASRPDLARRLLEINDPVSAAKIPRGNVRYTLRALEVLLASGRRVSERLRGQDRWSQRWRVRRVGILRDREDLYARIAARVRRMLENGWREEVGRLLEAGVSPQSNSFRAIGYREVADLVEGRIDAAEAERKIVTATRQLAKRQRTWLAREPDVLWIEATDALAETLALLARGGAQRGSDGP